MDRTLVLVLVVLGIAIAVLWILLPFAVFGLKGLVRDVLREQRTTNDLLRQLLHDRKPPS